jgi:hypothetical protein
MLPPQSHTNRLCRRMLMCVLSAFLFNAPNVRYQGHYQPDHNQLCCAQSSPPLVHETPGSKILPSSPYLKVSPPVRILSDFQEWEGDQQPHTLSVVELNRGGFKYWGYYGLNYGRGTGLARSNDLLRWTKYEKNPLWYNARWTSAIIDTEQPGRLYFAITRDYDTPESYIVLASSEDGIHLKEIGTLVKKHAGGRIRNQNPNLYRDPVTGKFLLTFYRSNRKDSSSIICKAANNVAGLMNASEKLLLHDTETLAAPNLLYIPRASMYFLSTEIYPKLSSGAEWQIKVFFSENAEGPYQPVMNNPIQSGGRACLFQHIFDGRYYGFQSHLAEKWVMEVIRDLP